MLCEGPTFELPGEAAADKQLPSGATRDPARRGAAHFAGRKVPGTFSVSRYSSVCSSLSESVQCGKSAALGASLGVGPAPKVVCRSKSATPPSSPFLLGTASPWSNLAAIPPHRSRDESRPPCSGQPGYGRPGRWRRQCQSVACLQSVPASATFPLISTASSSRACRNPVPARHRLRGTPRISVVAEYSYSTISACSRKPLYPASTSVRAHSFGPSRPRPRRPSPSPRCRSLSGSGSLKSPSPCAAKARHPHRTRPPPRPRSTSFRALGHLETQRPVHASMPVPTSTTSPAPPSSL